MADSTIVVKVRNGGVYEGKLLEDVKDVYLQMKANDNKIYTFTYGTIVEVKSKNGGAVFSQELSPIEASNAGPVRASWHDSLYTADSKYLWWNKAWLVNGDDTVCIKIEYKDDYANRNKEIDRLGTSWVEIVNKKGEAKRITPFSASQLFVQEGREVIKYITLPDSSNDWYKVIIDGKCKLLSHKGLSKQQRQAIAGGGALGGILGGAIASAATQGKGDGNIWIAYYDSQLWELADKFQSKGVSFFSDCLALAEKIAAGTYTYQDKREVVTEFNKCIYWR